MHITALQYSQTISDELVLRNFELLKDLDYEAIDAAILIHQKDPKNGRFMPKVADIFHAAKDIKRPVSSAEHLRHEIVAQFQEKASMVEAISGLLAKNCPEEYVQALQQQLRKNDQDCKALIRKLQALGITVLRE